jgi:hypothetical protein
VSPFSRFVIAVAMASLPFLAGAEGKCNDDPFALPDGSLAVTWSIPILEAKVDRKPAGTLLADLDARFGGEPDGFPAEYSANLAQYDFPAHPKTDQKHGDSDAVGKWLGEFKIPLEPPARSALDAYFAPQQCAAKAGETRSTCSITGLDCDATKPCAKVFTYGWVIRHPPVKDNGKGYKFCTCTLQRAALVFYGDKEELWVRTRFRSASDATAFVNFVPSTPVVFTFDTKRIWFPLALNRILPEAGKPGYLFLDVLTKTPLDVNRIPAGFSLKRMEQTVAYDNATWYVTRIWRRYETGGPAYDLLVVP